MTEHEIEVIDEMSRTGGGFVHHLAEAWRRADADNHQKLLAAFITYWADYEKRAAERKRRAAGLSR